MRFTASSRRAFVALTLLASACTDGTVATGAAHNALWGSWSPSLAPYVPPPPGSDLVVKRILLAEDGRLSVELENLGAAAAPPLPLARVAYAH